MRNTLIENIKRINELIHLTEDDNVGEYIDSTYLKTSGEAGTFIFGFLPETAFDCNLS